MFKSFLEHSIKSALRNARFDLRLLLKVFTGISIFYFYIVLFYLGFDFNRLIQLINPSANPITFLNYRLVHICMVVFVLQVFSPQNPLKAILSYLHLPINRTKLISYILVSSLFNFILIGLFLFFIPYSIRIILSQYGFQQFLFYILGVLIIFLSVSYSSLLFRNLIAISFTFIILPLCLICILYFLNLFLNISFITISTFIFEQVIIRNFYFLFLLIGILAGLVVVNFFILKKVFYKIYQNQKYLLNYANLIDPYFFKSNLFDYALLEIKLITRNKRIRGFLLLAVILLILFYNVLPQNDEGLYFKFIVYILISGMFGYIFSQYLFSWESSYFDFILSKKFDIRKYLKAKYFIYLILGLIVFVAFLPIVKPSKIETHMFLSALLYNSSFGYFICFFLATFNKSKIDLDGNIFFNLQGFNSTQVLGIMIIILLPCLILFLLSFELNLTQSMMILNFLCIVALLNQKKGWQTILNQLLKRKYKNLDGYRG